MKIFQGKNLLDVFRRANKPSKFEDVAQKKSGGYNEKRVRYGRTGDSSGNKNGRGK